MSKFSKKKNSVHCLVSSGLIALLGIVLVGESVGAVAKSAGVELAQEQATSNEAIRKEAKRLTDEGLQLYEQETTQSIKQAIKKWERALELWQKVGDKKWQATTMVELGSAHRDLYNNQQAINLYNQALPILREIGDKGIEATTLVNLGGVHSNLGNNKQALNLYNQALPMLREVGNKFWETTTLLQVGSVLSELGNNQQALNFYNQSLILSQEINDEFFQATSHYRIGRIYSTLGDKQVALKNYNLALSINRKIGEKIQQIKNLNSIGVIHYALGNKQQALKQYNKALLLIRDAGDEAQEAPILNNIAEVYRSSGHYQRALNHYNQALSISRKFENKRGEASILNNIASAYFFLGDKQQALKFLKQALSLVEIIGNKGAQSTTLNNIALIYNELGDRQRSLNFNNQALSLSQEIEDKGGEATTLNNIALIYNDLGNKQQALELLLNQVLSVRREVGDKPGEANTLGNIGSIYLDLGNKQQALKYSNQALVLVRQVGEKDGEAKILHDISKAHRDNSNLQAALNNSKAAIDITENLRTKVNSNDLRTSYFATQQDTYKLHIDILMQLHKQNPSKGYDIQALNASEKSRARGLLELLTEANADIRKGANPELLAQERKLQQQIDAKEKLRLKIANTLKDKNQGKDPISENAVKRYKKQIQNHIFEYKQLKARIKQSNPQYAALKYPEPLNLTQIQQQLDKDTVLLQYSLGKDRSYLWTVTPNSLDSYELPKREEIETAAAKFKELLKKCESPFINCQDLPAAQKAKDYQEITQAATELSKLVFAPVSKKLGKKRLVIVADGALLEIPFAALSEPNQTDYQPLLVNREIVNLPSVSAIAIHRDELKQRQTAPKTLAVLADAVFTTDDERVTGKPPALAPELDLRDSMLRKAAKNYNRAGWERLKGTRTEAEEILKLIPASDTLQAFDFDANYNWITNKQLKQYRFIHLATHGFANPDNPELSGILLSAVDKQHKPYDRNSLLLGDIFNLDWGADLVVLSACETGLGKGVPGEGLIGLTRGLMYAGAKHAVISLWQVDDTATSQLIPQVYQAILEKNTSPATALRQAQLQMWQQKEWRNPYYWAAFTSQGEWK